MFLTRIIPQAKVKLVNEFNFIKLTKNIEILLIELFILRFKYSRMNLYDIPWLSINYIRVASYRSPIGNSNR